MKTLRASMSITGLYMSAYITGDYISAYITGVYMSAYIFCMSICLHTLRVSICQYMYVYMSAYITGVYVRINIWARSSCALRIEQRTLCWRFWYAVRRKPFQNLPTKLEQFHWKRRERLKDIKQRLKEETGPTGLHKLYFQNYTGIKLLSFGDNVFDCFFFFFKPTILILCW